MSEHARATDLGNMAEIVSVYGERIAFMLHAYAALVRAVAASDSPVLKVALRDELQALLDEQPDTVGFDRATLLSWIVNLSVD